MKRIVVAGFHQESNAFNPIVADEKIFSRSYIRGEAILGLTGASIPIGGILEELKASDVEIIPSSVVFAQSGGKVAQSVIDAFVEETISTINKSGTIDGVFLMLHGATQSTEHDDASGYIVSHIREAVGKDVIISISVDLHANITSKLFGEADVICGYRKYPHVDMKETGKRCVRAGLAFMEKPFEKYGVSIPMIFPAGAYTTEDGPVAELMEAAKGLAGEMGLMEYSICQMQPWLDVEEGGSAIIAYGYDMKLLKEFAFKLSVLQLDLAGNVVQELTSVKDVIDEVLKKKSKKPSVICDAADSPNAGALGDDAYVLKEVLESGKDISFAFAIEDPPAALLAHSLGEGATGHFTIGGSKCHSSIKTMIDAEVLKISDGKYVSRSKIFAGTEMNMGKTAVLGVGNIRILACETLSGTNDPYMYEAFGIDPLKIQLIDVKACTSFRNAYGPICERIYECNTHGVAALDLTTLKYQKLPKPFYPFDPIEKVKNQVKEL